MDKASTPNGVFQDRLSSILVFSALCVLDEIVSRFSISEMIYRKMNIVLTFKLYVNNTSKM